MSVIVACGDVVCRDQSCLSPVVVGIAHRIRGLELSI